MSRRVSTTLYIERIGYEIEIEVVADVSVYGGQGPSLDYPGDPPEVNVDIVSVTNTLTGNELEGDLTSSELDRVHELLEEAYEEACYG